MKPIAADLQAVADFLDPQDVGHLPDPDTCQRVGKFLKQLALSAPAAVRWERRRAHGDGSGRLVWNEWKPCSLAEAHRVEGLRTWEVRMVTSCVTAGAGWLPTTENINALPEPLRLYIAGLETLCDPAGIVRENTLLKDCNKGLQAMYRKAVDADVPPSDAPSDGFNGDTPHLINCMRALVNLNDAGALTPHGIGGHARALLLAAAVRLERAAGVAIPFKAEPEA